MTYHMANGNPGPDMGRAQKSGRFKVVNVNIIHFLTS